VARRGAGRSISGKSPRPRGPDPVAPRLRVSGTVCVCWRPARQYAQIFAGDGRADHHPIAGSEAAHGGPTSSTTPTPSWPPMVPSFIPGMYRATRVLSPALPFVSDFWTRVPDGNRLVRNNLRPDRYHRNRSQPARGRCRLRRELEGISGCAAL
jgi:hypothetical protein